MRYCILIVFVLAVSIVFAGERKALDEKVLVGESQFIFAGEVLALEESKEIIDGRHSRVAKVWIYEVLKGNIKPSFVEPKREVGILVAIPRGKDGTIVLQEQRTYLFFVNRTDSKSETYALLSRSHGAIPMHFKETDQLINHAERIKRIKVIINNKK